MSSVVLTGSSGVLGRRVAARLASSSHVERLVGLDRALPAGPADWETHRVDLLADDLAPWFSGAGAVVHLASPFGSSTSERALPGVDEEEALARRVLDAALGAGVDQVVLLSSATVYGAHADNPIPLTEEAPLVPNPGFPYVDAKMALERLAAELADTHPGVRIAVFRPTTAVAEDATSWMSRALAAAAGLRIGEVDPPVQFLHFDDLATATVLAVERGLSGAYNVAPDGWIPPDAMRALSGVPSVRVPVGVGRGLASMRWRLKVSQAPADVLPWAMHPWVVANDRLRAAGWEPAHTNEEAYVASTAPGPLDTLSPKRRQELALAVVGAAMTAAALGAGVLVRRHLRDRP